MTTPIEPITPRPPQWSQDDLDLAVADGAHERIRQAQDAGQLNNLLTAKRPEPKRTTPRWSAPIGNTDADLHRAAQVAATFNDERNQA